MLNNRQIIKDTTNTTADLVNGGLLLPEQSEQFYVQVLENTVLGGMIRHQMKKSPTGEIDKIGIQPRILRKKIENTDDNYRVKPDYSKLEYSCVAVRLPWEITEESLRQNIERENLESIIANLMTKQMGIDLEDLSINGDIATASSDPDYDFLKVNDGFIKILKEKSHTEDRSSKSSGEMCLDVFYDALKQLPSKYNNGTLNWLMSPSRKQDWDKYLYNEFLKNGGMFADRLFNNPAAIQAVEIPKMPNDKIILVNPQNLAMVNTYNVIIRKTTEGPQAIYQDKRFYVVHFDFDVVIEEPEAAVLITGLV